MVKLKKNKETKDVECFVWKYFFLIYSYVISKNYSCKKNKKL